MDGTFHTSSGLAGITRQGLPMGWRITGFVTAVAIGAFVIGWVDINTWHRIRELEREFGDIKAERYYLGVHVRVWIQRLNDTLLSYHRERDQAALGRFHEGKAELASWMQSRKAEVQSEDGRATFAALENAYATYLTNSAALAHPNEIRMENDPFERVYERLQQISKPCFDQSIALVKLERRDFDSFILQSQNTLDSLQHLLSLSVVLLLALSATLVMVVYRGMIAPLRVQLDQSQDLIHRQEKLASLGVLAAGVAHEIRNPLTAIKFRLFSLKKSIPSQHAEGEDATVIGNELQRLERIVRDFLDFARPSEPELIRVPAGRLLQDVHALLNSQLDKASIRLTVEEADDLWVNADSQQLKQVLINLVQNAAESIGRRGTITLRALADRMTLSGVARQVICLEVADSGKGIPPDVQQRLFDPFFTTKEGGTGLGLPIAARIVEKHGGELRYQTQLNRGTTFRVVLPRRTDHET